MRFSIYKKPTGVLLLGLVCLGLYFLVAVTLFRQSDLYFLILGGGVWWAVMILVRCIGSLFVSTFTVTDEYIETVTGVGGIIRIRFADLDRERTVLSVAGLELVPHKGESLFLPVGLHSRRDIARLANHIGIESAEWPREM